TKATGAGEDKFKTVSRPLGNESRAIEARELLAEARRKLDRGNVEAAADLKARVEKLSAGWDVVAYGPAPWGNDLSALTRDLDQAAAAMPKPPEQVAIAPPLLSPADRGQALLPPAVMGLGKQHARALLAEAQTLRMEGRLIE